MMTSTQRALLAAICKTPEDDTPRMMMADHFDEYDQPERAEFFRVQVELATWGDRRTMAEVMADRRNAVGGGCCEKFAEYQPCDCIEEALAGEEAERVASLRRREQELLMSRDAIEWRRVPWGNLPRSAFRRGFPHTLTLSWADWLKHERQIYWRPVPCERCRGSGSVPLSREPCSDSETDCPRCRGSGEALPTDECSGCPACRPDEFETGCQIRCNGSGRVPRECPETASPITEVRLTRLPQPWEFTEVASRHNLPPLSVAGSVEACWEAFFAVQWPRLRFVLPSEAPGTRRWPAWGRRG